MFVVFDHGQYVFRMDTESGETWKLSEYGAEFTWVAVKEESAEPLAVLAERILRES